MARTVINVTPVGTWINLGQGNMLIDIKNNAGGNSTRMLIDTTAVAVEPADDETAKVVRGVDRNAQFFSTVSTDFIWCKAVDGVWDVIRDV